MEKISVRSEIGKLRKLLIHSPDGGIGKVVPKKAQELLYEDIVDLELMQKEYDEYVLSLLLFLDPEKITINKINEIKSFYNKNERPPFFIPGKEEYFNSEFVLDSQKILEKTLENRKVKNRLIIAVCAVESVLHLIDDLIEIDDLERLTKILISGYDGKTYLFPPIPNFIFTRDISITVGEKLLLSKTAYKARGRESILIKHIGKQIFGSDDKLISLNEENEFTLMTEEEQIEKRITLEGGDVMMISHDHLIVGCSERTTSYAIMQLIDRLFNDKDQAPINKVSVIQIPPKRDWMHIDTIFSQVKRDCWVLYAPLCNPSEVKEINGVKKALLGNDHDADEVKVTQFKNINGKVEIEKFDTIEKLCINISKVDFGCTGEVDIIYSGGGVFPYDEREQWTDACNLLALDEGVVVGYNRNKKTLEEFSKRGFKVRSIWELLDEFFAKEFDPSKAGKLFIAIASSELSRARGGSHCMSMPLIRGLVK